MIVRGKRVSLFILAVLFGTALLTPLVPNGRVSAAQITARKLTLSDSTGNAAGVTYTFNFTLPTTGTAIKSLSVDICTTASGTCTLPTGFLNNTSTLVSQPTNLGAATGWTVNTATGGSLRILNASNATNPTGSQTVVFGSVHNPTAVNTTFFGRITTYSDAAWTTIVDGGGTSGTVAASTSNAIVLTGVMPESLIFCTGGHIDVSVGNIPVCSTATSGAVGFNQLFSPQSTTWATSQMAASTNAGSGYVITVTGPTMTSGGNTIAAIGSTAATSNVGAGQFGLNLVDDSADTTIGTGSTNPITYYTDPASHTGGNVYPAANGTNLRGQAKANFNTASSYAFAAGTSNVVAASDYTAAGATDGQRFTSTYIVNVSGSQPAGTYVSTLIYICTPTF